MKKIFFILTVFMFDAGFAYGDNLITSNTPNGCDFNDPNQALWASFEPNEYTCNAGYYLPADETECANCLTGYTCAGGTYAFNETTNQGIDLTVPITINVDNGCGKTGGRLLAQFAPNEYTCNAGYYLPADETECAQCPSGSACVGGTYAFNETTDQGIQSCASGTFAPSGSAVCYPHIFHVGNDIMYMKSVKQTTPSLNIQIGNDIFYINMTTTRTRMNKDSIHYFHVDWDDKHYYVCDDTMCPDAE